jgi:4-amino-4-deoxy-L-arabinose transferase-like glycosyltransferase
MGNDHQKSHTLCLALLLLGALGLRLWFFHGIDSSDQITYSHLSYRLLGGQWLGNSFYEASTRWGFLLPTAVIYRLFGVGEWSSTLWSMLLSLGTIVVGYRLGKYISGHRAGWLAALLIAIFPLEVAYAGQLMADVPLSFWLLLSLYWLVRGDDSGTLRIRGQYFFASGLALGMAYATKFVAILICPLFVLLIVIRRRIDWSQAWVACGFAIVFAAEFLLFEHYTGNGWMRLESILADRADTARLSTAQAAALKLDTLSTSVWHYLYWLFVDVHYVGGAFVLLGLIAGVALLVPRRMETQQSLAHGYWLALLWAATFLVMLSCYPTSTEPYVPLYKMPNYMLMFTAPLLVALAVLLARMSQQFQSISIAALGVSALFCVIFSYESHRERVDNIRALYTFAAKHTARPLYGLKRDLDLLPFFAGFAPANEYRIIGTERFGKQAQAVDDLSSLRRAYIAVDHHFLIYDKARYDFPPQLTAPPLSWRVVFTYQRQPHWLKELILGIAEAANQRELLNNSVHAVLRAKLQSWSHIDPLVIYAVD